jgi:hypothetical protein
MSTGRWVPLSHPARLIFALRWVRLVRWGIFSVNWSFYSKIWVSGGQVPKSPVPNFGQSSNKGHIQVTQFSQKIPEKKA